ncbi:MAG: hypothetical protein H0W34_10215, partial [Pyrinomonadaceae bacterium]|nr:hypothetical protein [Pyrinomonadaceae bacterium]
MVVKKLMVTEGGGLLRQASQHIPIDQTTTFTGRTRQILNVCVPHFGARPLFGFLAALFTIVTLPIALVLEVIRWIVLNFSVDIRVGINMIGLELVHWNPQLQALDDTMLKLEQQFLEAELPFPASHNFGALDDLTIEQQRERPPDTTRLIELGEIERLRYRPTQQIPMRGFHPFSSLGLPLLDALRTCLRPFSTPMSYLVAERILALTHYVDCDRGVKDLLGSLSDPKTVGSQKQVFEYFLRLCERPVPNPRVYRVAGIAGVGKTRLLSRLARHLSIRYLRADPAFAREVYYVQMRDLDVGQIPSAGGTVDGDLACKMIEAWISYAKTSVPGCERQVTANHFRESLLKGDYILIVDGLDDFLKNNEVRWQELEAAFEILFSKIAGNEQGGTNRLLILGSRSGEEGLADLYDKHPIVRCEVELLSDEIIETCFPDAWALIKKFQSVDGVNVDKKKQREALNLLRTPLVITSLDRAAVDSPSLLQSPSLAQVLDATLRAIIRQTHWPESLKQIPSFQRVVADVLTIVARVNYGSPAVLFTLDDVRKTIPYLVSVWRGHLADAARQAPFDVIFGELGTMDEQTKAQLGRDQFEVSQEKDDNMLAAVLRTVFQNLAGHTWNYVHGSWEDFLVARYYFVCAKYGVIDEFGALGYLPNVTAMAADLLASDAGTPKEDGKYVIPAELIDAARVRAREKANLFYVCNALALAVWNREHTTVNGPSQKALVKCLEIPAVSAEEDTLEQVSEVTTVQRCFVLNGLAIRCLEQVPSGGSASAQLGGLSLTLQEGIKLGDVDTLFAHLC